jgi:ribosomal-protein-alanine N-acetyltransferase
MTSASLPLPGSPAAIEPATWRDLNALRQVERACFSEDTWPLLDLIGVLTLPNIVRLKAMVDGSMVGFVAADIRSSEAMAWITTIGVIPEFRGQGIGEALMAACESRITVPRLRLSVRISNQPAIRLYRRLGYQEIGTWPDYYSGPEDALVMEKWLEGS